MKHIVLDPDTALVMGKVAEAFRMYQREYLCKSERETDEELERFIHCHEYVTNNEY